MTDVVTARNGAARQAPREPMRVDVDLPTILLIGKLAVEPLSAPAGTVRGPFPTAARVLADMRPETGDGFLAV